MSPGPPAEQALQSVTVHLVPVPQNADHDGRALGSLIDYSWSSKRHYMVIIDP